MKCFPKKYLVTLFLLTFYLFSVEGTFGMPLLSNLLDNNHSTSVTASHGNIHLNRAHTGAHEPHDHHDNDFFDTHTGLIDTGHKHSEHESHLNDYAEDAIVKSENVASFQLSYPVNTFNTIPVITTYRYSVAYIKTPPLPYLALSHISTTILLI